MQKQHPKTGQRSSGSPYSDFSPDEARLVRQLDRALRILRMKQLMERTNLSRATLYVLMGTDSTFPKKLKLTKRSIGFLESEVDAWIESRAQLRGAA